MACLGIVLSASSWPITALKSVVPLVISRSSRVAIPKQGLLQKYCAHTACIYQCQYLEQQHERRQTNCVCGCVFRATNLHMQVSSLTSAVKAKERAEGERFSGILRINHPAVDKAHINTSLYHTQTTPRACGFVPTCNAFTHIGI